MSVAHHQPSVAIPLRARTTVLVIALTIMAAAVTAGVIVANRGATDVAQPSVGREVEVAQFERLASLYAAQAGVPGEAGVARGPDEVAQFERLASLYAAQTGATEADEIARLQGLADIFDDTSFAAPDYARSAEIARLQGLADIFDDTSFAVPDYSELAEKVKMKSNHTR